MGVPKKVLRGKAAQRLHEDVAKQFLLRLEKLMEEGKLGKDALPAAEYLADITKMKIPPLAKKRANEFELSQKETLAMLSEVAAELESGPQSELKNEVGKIRAKLEEKVRGL